MNAAAGYAVFTAANLLIHCVVLLVIMCIMFACDDNLFGVVAVGQIWYSYRSSEPAGDLHHSCVVGQCQTTQPAQI